MSHREQFATIHRLYKPGPTCFILLLTMSISSALAQPKPRARELGIAFEGTPGALNAITDVAGVAVGHTTLISGEGKLVVGEVPVRTGVAVVLPRGKDTLGRRLRGGVS